MQIEVKKLEKYIDIYDIFRVLMSQNKFKENKISFLDSSLKNKYGKYSIIGINPYLELKEKDNNCFWYINIFLMSCLYIFKFSSIIIRKICYSS